LGSGNTLNTVGVVLSLAVVLLLPLFIVTMTGFLKISVVLFIVRNAIGLQQTPPNTVLYSIALILTIAISTPVVSEIYGRLTQNTVDLYTIEGITSAANLVKEPIQANLNRFTTPQTRKSFHSAIIRVWPESERSKLSEDSFAVLLPAFVSSELTWAFEIGFLLYLPFLIIDLVVSTILIAMGMIFVSPILISVPLKLLLFVAVDGWSRLLQGLILSYS
jgi:type III secretion protein R